jgi:PAS domain S-box-containing protein
MNFDLSGLKLAIIGGSDPCEEILEILLGPDLKPLGIEVCLVADRLVHNRGVEQAKKLGVPTSTSYEDLLGITGLDLIIKVKNDERLVPVLKAVEQAGIRVMDLDDYQAISFTTFLKTQEKKIRIKEKLAACGIDQPAAMALFDEFSDHVIAVCDQKISYLKTEREDLIEMEEEFSQVIQGSMIPTFIINKDHILTHWNRACEELTGHNAYELVGTDRQWVPFRSAKRPTLADVVVSQMSEAEVEKFYGGAWRKSKLIQEAYEAEEFFPHLGKEGKWIFFTAAPIKSADGRIIGAIETLRDQTEDKKAQEEIEFQDQN